MMGIVGYSGPMMNGGDGGLLAFVTWLVIIADLILLGFWLWKHVTK